MFMEGRSTPPDTEDTESAKEITRQPNGTTGHSCAGNSPVLSNALKFWIPACAAVRPDQPSWEKTSGGLYSAEVIRKNYPSRGSWRRALLQKELGEKRGQEKIIRRGGLAATG